MPSGCCDSQHSSVSARPDTSVRQQARESPPQLSPASQWSRTMAVAPEFVRPGLQRPATRAPRSPPTRASFRGPRLAGRTLRYRFRFLLFRLLVFVVARRLVGIVGVVALLVALLVGGG